MTNSLHQHGSRICLELVPILEEQSGAVLPVCDNKNVSPDTSNSIHGYLKSETAAYSAQTLGWLKNTYAEAIEFTSMTRELRGMAFMYGVALGLAMAVGIGGCGIFGVVMGSFSTWQESLIFLGGIVMAAGGIAVGFYIFALLGRIDLYRPSDLPIIFDRKHRKVYRLLLDEQSGLKGMFKRWPIIACEYDWNLVDAEHHVETYVTAAGVNRNHNLLFIVRKSQDDPTPIDIFQIANAHALGDNLVDAMWEHIRRFMEEGGPHLPDPTEPLASSDAPVSWWESMGVVGPYGPKFSTHWNNAPVLTLFILLLFPVTLPILLLWGTGNYLSFKTEIPVQWPAIVFDRIGAPMSR